ncbi:hypothetical protein BCE75_102266 [Isoptericola sp. CG 20/1183]|uniref:DUF624 domain-containing protein n=1 Tax=Isoptericola halotolerans TaxID=300560 RepID=A0ABX5EL07_9MICO|nr:MULTISPECIES: hypothetical protein [Isoptericola]PRZ09552.1 hypothetical protein BCE75_102266 [Isoptericola sp. CG 20/1183]PRZ10353.1 hypothetical protein BCL65_101498 [Isoptericola halotolerans]
MLASLHLFAQVAVTGVLVAVGSVPLVTLVPSLAAGVAHLRRDLTGRDTTLRRFAADWWAAVRSLWLLGLAVVALAVLLIGDWQLAASGVIPGATVVAVVVALFAAGAVAVVLRAAGAWSDDDGEPVPGASTRATLSVATGRATDDLTGSALLAAAVLMAAVLVWMLLPLALVVGGLLALAVVGVETRRRAQPGSTT